MQNNLSPFLKIIYEMGRRDGQNKNDRNSDTLEIKEEIVKRFGALLENGTTRDAVDTIKSEMEQINTVYNEGYEEGETLPFRSMFFGK